jgi:hypothetical protein
MMRPGASGSFLCAVLTAIMRGLIKGVFFGLAFFVVHDHLTHRRRDRCDRF